MNDQQQEADKLLDDGLGILTRAERELATKFNIPYEEWIRQRKKAQAFKMSEEITQADHELVEKVVLKYHMEDIISIKRKVTVIWVFTLITFGLTLTDKLSAIWSKIQ